MATAMACVRKTCLILLLIFFEGTRAFHLANLIVNSHLLPTYSYYLIAPELFRNGNFAFAVVETSEQKSDKVGIDISVSIADSADYSKCSLTLRPDDADSQIIVTSLRRLSDKKVVLMGSEVYSNERRKGLLFVLDVKTCETLYLYSSFSLSESDVLVTREISDKFEMFVDRRSAHLACAESKSRITFQPGKKEFNCFDVDLKWPGIFVGAFSFSEDVVMVRGFDDTGIYKTLVYNTAIYPYRQQLWLTLPRATNKTQVVSSDLAVCWILNLGDDKSVHCSLLERSGDLRLNKTLTYEEPVRLLSVSHSESASEIILMTEKAHCNSIANSDCQSVFVSKVSDESASHRVIKLNCSAVDKKRLAVDARQIIAKGAIVLEYVCESSLFQNQYSPNYFALHSVTFDDS